MSIQVSCPSCKSDVFVDEALAGKDILCPTCKQRMTVPSIAAGRPDVKLSGAEFEEGDAGRGGMTAGPPRWREGDDYDVPARRDPSRWNATLTGLAMMFWTGLVLTIVSLLAGIAILAMGSNLQRMLGNNPPGAPPPPEAMGLFVGMAAVGCVMVVLLIIYYVGMCMCCTVPRESGAKGRALAAVILFAVTVVGHLVASMAIGLAAGIQGVQQGQAGGQVRISPTPLIVSGILVGLGMTLVVVMWMLFHKAIGHHFSNGKLAKASTWYIALFVVFVIGNQILQIMANPIMQGGNVLAVEFNSPMMITAQIWSLVWTVGLSVFLLLIIRETRRTILEDQTVQERGDAMEHDGA